MAIDSKPIRKSRARATSARAGLMMEMLALLLEEFAELGLRDDAGAHIHELMGLAYRGGRAAPVSSRTKPARKSASRRASAVSRP